LHDRQCAHLRRRCLRAADQHGRYARLRVIATTLPPTRSVSR
jgi:hypothetical protein